MIGLVGGQEVAYGAVVGLVAEILAADQVARDEVVIAALLGTEDGVQDAEGVEVWRMTGMADWESERAAGLLREARPG